VSLYSQVGVGTQVRLYLPRARVGAAAPAPPAEPSAAIQGGDETILVIEDNHDMREVTCEQLKRLGYRVLAAGDAAAGLEAIEQHREIALLLCDIVLGGGPSGP